MSISIWCEAMMSKFEEMAGLDGWRPKGTNTGATFDNST
jgi:hypothetical protein